MLHLLDGEMKIRVQLTEEDYVSTLWPTLFSNRRTLVFLILAAISTLVTAGSNIADLLRGEPVESSRWVFVSVMVVLAWVLFIGTPSKMRKAFRVQKLGERPFEVELGEEEFKSTNDRGYTVLKWPDVLKWRQTKKMIVVYVTEQQCVVLPHHAFSSEGDFSAAVTILQSKVGKTA
ncbi:YcxB family protein [Luteolibacter ambystomatis]|uniref:YcxB family protein n=1 Tax=Luteolibacter ambystomatis TaxID=2824561 RepID=A0A975IYD5_9BACT|nr:YcxB family protein [Luteolibacter ambystomatis]QUE49768.1 YcxB family protein [Luteolibacter ambystomatis]